MIKKHMKPSKHIVAILSLILCVCNIIFTAEPIHAEEASYGIYLSAPEDITFEVKDTNGNVYTEKSFKGENVVIVLGKIDCMYTQRTFEVLDKLRGIGKEFQVLDLLTSDAVSDTSKSIESHISEFPNNIVSTEYKKNKTWYFKLREDSRISGNYTPIILILNKDGKLAFITEGSKSMKGVHEGLSLLGRDETSGLKEDPVYTVSGTINYEEIYKVIDIVNEERNKDGKSRLYMDEELLKLANQRAAELSFHFGHDRSNGDGLETLGIAGQVAIDWSENIAMGFRNAKDAMNGWMTSEGHRKTILNYDWNAMGVGVFEVNGVKYWVQLFSDTWGKIPQMRNDVIQEEFDIKADIFTTPSFEKSDYSLSVGDSEILRTHIKTDVTTHREVNNRSYTWQSSNTKVASVNPAGKVTAIGKGTAVITASNKAKPSVTIETTITVNPLEKIASKLATCTSDGNIEYYQNGKGSYYTDVQGKNKVDLSKTVIKALGHSYGDWTKINDIQHQRVCANDKSHVEKANHTWDSGKVTKAATESSTGVKTYTCTTCKATKTEAIPKVSHVHTLNKISFKAATCLASGNIEYYTCSGCKKAFKDSKGKTEIQESDTIVKALGHSYGSWTKLNDIQHQRVCAYDSSHVEKANHTWDSGKVTKAATESSTGVKTYTCTTCKATKTETIPKVSHVHTLNKISFKAATCLASGNIEYYTCSGCKKAFKDSKGKTEIQESDTIVKALGHSYGSWTKLNDAQHQRVCANDKSHVEKANHTWDSGKVTKAATESSTGVKTYTCTTCKATKTETIPKLTPTQQSKVWRRLSGTGRYDTMKVIVDEGFTKTGGTVVIATGTGFKDALAASGLAGIDKGPVVLTDGNNLSAQSKAILQRLKPKKIYVAGGTFAVKDQVLTQIRGATGVTPQRLYGQSSSGTSAALANAGKGKWKDATAIIATNKSFKDALSVAPIAYAKSYPILLADDGKNLSEDVLNALKNIGTKQVIIVGGTGAVTTNVETQLKNAGISIKTRLAGANGVATSAQIARWGLQNGMTANKMGVATSQNYPDALAGAALCGYNRSVLVLADDEAQANATFPKAYKSAISRGYVFGGEFAVGKSTFAKLEESVK